MKTEATRADKTKSPVPEASATRRGSPWRRMVLGGAVASAVVLAATMVVIGEVIPPLVVFAVLFLAGAAIARWKERPGAIALGVLAVLFLALDAPFIVPSLTVPASTADFLLTFFAVLASVTTLVAAVWVARRSPGLRAARFGGAMVALALLGIGVAVVARAGYAQAEARPGDEVLVAEEFEFGSAVVRTDSGDVSVFLENRDAALHTFTIEELGVDLEVPANSSGRVTFEARPGRYEFICVPHQPDMGGTLEVE